MPMQEVNAIRQVLESFVRCDGVEVPVREQVTQPDLPEYKKTYVHQYDDTGFIKASTVTEETLLSTLNHSNDTHTQSTALYIGRRLERVCFDETGHKTYAESILQDQSDRVVSKEQFIGFYHEHQQKEYIKVEFRYNEQPTEQSTLIRHSTYSPSGAQKHAQALIFNAIIDYDSDMIRHQSQDNYHPLLTIHEQHEYKDSGDPEHPDLTRATIVFLRQGGGIDRRVTKHYQSSRMIASMIERSTDSENPIPFPQLRTEIHYTPSGLPETIESVEFQEHKTMRMTERVNHRTGIVEQTKERFDPRAEKFIIQERHSFAGKPYHFQRSKE